MKRTPIWLLLFIGAIGHISAQAPADSLHIAHYTIQLDLTRYQTQQLYGTAILKAVPNHPLPALTLELMQLQADSVTVGGKKMRFSQEGDRLRIPAENTPFAQGDTLEIRVSYHGKPYSERFGGFYFSGEYAFNMGACIEHIPHTAGKTWFPCVDSFTDKAAYTYKVHTVSGHRAVCGGLFADSLRLADSSIVWTWEQRQPIPAYLASVACGPYIVWRDTLRSIDGRKLPVEIDVHPSAANKVAGSFSRLKQIVALFEHSFGPYPFDRIGYVTVPFTSGAMEHAGNIAYPLAAVDGSWNRESLYAHELSHAWFGDWVTCESAEEMWLNEGFASWCEGLLAEYFSHNDSLPHQDSNAYRNWFRQQHRYVLKNAAIRDNGYHPLSPMPQAVTYGTTTYQKGSLVLHSLRSYLGDSLFFHCLKQYVREFGGGNASSQQFFSLLSRESGLPMKDFMAAWVTQPGFLHFSVDSVTATGNGLYRTHLRQRLHHAERYGNSNRITVSYFFPDSARKDLRTVFSGQYGTFDCQLPQPPLFAVVDLYDGYADAVIDTTLTVNGTQTVDFEEGNIMVRNAKGEGGWLRIEHNLVAADPLKQANSHIRQLSGSHYWRLLLQGTQAEGLYFSYYAQSENDLDHALFKEADKKSFLLLHRPDASADWRVIPFVQTGTAGRGNLYTTFVQNGEYCLAVGDTNGMAALPAAPRDIAIRIHPNPASQTVRITVSDANSVRWMRLYNAAGQRIATLPIRQTVTEVDLSHFSHGLYLIDFMDNRSICVGHAKIIVK